MKKAFMAMMGIMLGLLPLRAAPAVSEPQYEDILVYMRVQGVGAFELNSYYSYDNNRLYLPVAELFQFLKINQEASPDFSVIKGFLVDEKRRYVIDHTLRTIRIDGTTLSLQETDLLKTETGLFLNSDVFGKAFGLFCTFHFRSLSVELKTALELPAIREMRLQQMRRNIEQLRGELKVDTAWGRQYHLFRFGMVDWALSSTQVLRSTTDTRMALGLGSELLCGEANLFLNYSTREGFDKRNQHYQWRWANNQTRIIRQVRAGKIAPSSISSIYDPLIGVSATNAPTTYRRSFGQYTISDFSEPGWTVELYINNVIVDYQTADASGFYTFHVPLVYGTSQVMLKFYGPYGEERIREQFINIPFNFLPKGELEYTITGGMVQDSLHSLYSRGEIKYGINRFISLGAGFEHLSSIRSGPDIPFVSASVSPFRNLMLSGEYAHGVRTNAIMSYRLPSNLMLELNYTSNVKGQQAIRYNYLEERKATLSFPLPSKILRGFTRLSVKQTLYEMLTYNTADMTISTNFGPINANLSGFASWINNTTPFIYSNLAMGIRLWQGFTFRPQAQFDFNNKEITSFKADLEKRIKRSGYFSLGYEENIRAAYRSVNLTFSWDLRFAQTNLSARVGRDYVNTTQGARGSIAFGSGNNYVHAENRSSIGRGGLTITTFLDLNHNDIRDENEPLVTGVNVRMSGGRMLRLRNDSLVRIAELEPYTSYVVELDESGVENISWRIRHKVLSVTVDPNQFKKLTIPVCPMGEANGMIYRKDEKGLTGLGRIFLNFYKPDGTLHSRVLSEADGYITYLGLAPGQYYAKIDSTQLARLGMVAEPESISFEIHSSYNGDVVDGLDFVLQSLAEKD